MSYDCTNGATAPRINQFSNPVLSYNNVPAGNDASANCARRLAETRNYVAAARNQVQTTPFGAVVSWLPGRRCIDAPAWDSGRQVNMEYGRLVVLCSKRFEKRRLSYVSGLELDCEVRPCAILSH